MKIQTRPWAIASTIGTVIELVLGLGLSSLIGFILPRLVANSQISASGGMAMVSLGISTVRLCLCGSVYGLLVGALYAFTLPRDEYFTATEGAFGGSLSAGTASLSAGVLSLFVGLMFLVAQVGPQTGDATQLTSIIFTQLLTGLGGLLLGGVIALIMGAAGGGVTLAVARREKQ
jgi:hypothetical protein